ncbi:MotE family protein [Mangrovicoccus algicola]|uniref:Magnesium transporter MgtE intracellular domain-containing protein n=1 Tax=Mangrovicoccus algicola TaxID=2771008 RepID=A0A8J6YTN0_9RHOB|nr:hypothetical protein [Mangrovicoccus algicola]MBE3639033.1 hypothetical protein [Mangrovicoccus algicola]
MKRVSVDLVAGGLGAALLTASLTLMLTSATAQVDYRQEAERLYADEIRQMENAAEIDALLEDLKAARDRVAEQQAALEERTALLQEQETAIDAKLEELKEAEDRLQRMLGIAKQAAEADIAKMLTLYESMRPKEAARIFEMMDPSLASGFITRMDPAQASQILALLPSETSYAISAIIAGKNAR